jgi:hypothetical protein
MQLRLILALLGIFTFSLVNAQEINHIGTWESKNIESPMQMVLDDDGFISFIVNKQYLGGKNYYSEGNHLSMTYSANYIDSTGTLSITIKDPKTKKIIKRDTGTLTFIDPNNIELCFRKPVDEERTEFIDECVSFLKVK